MHVHLVFESFDDGVNDAEAPQEYLIGAFDGKEKAVEEITQHVKDKMLVNYPKRCYVNVRCEAVEDGDVTNINIYGDLAPGYSVGLKKRTNVLIHTPFYVVKAVVGQLSL